MVCPNYQVTLHDLFLLQQLWTVALCLAQPMAVLVTLLEQNINRQPTTVVIQATTLWETALACVKLQECGLGVHPPVKVRSYNIAPYAQHLGTRFGTVHLFIFPCKLEGNPICCSIAVQKKYINVILFL